MTPFDDDRDPRNRVYGGRYRVVRQVGTGGMATVYLGHDATLQRDVAIKVLHPHLANREDARARFNREAKAIARLHHPNIVDVFDYSAGDEADAYLITEFVHGVTLTAFCDAHGPFLPQASALIAHAVAGALIHAHAEGLVHRDIKPDNLMVSSDGVIKLMDFGIAMGEGIEKMTATGAILGSPAHMAPEQIEGGKVDHRVDIFAFGTLLYKLVTNELPFMASNPHALFRLILEGRYDPPSRYSAVIGRRFEEILATCMAREPQDRFATMTAVQEALDAYLRTYQMEDVPRLLPRLLQAPEQFRVEWRPVLVQVLSAEGRRQAREGSLALAINAYNRALAMDPDATEPRRGLSDLTSRSRRRKRFKTLAMITAALAVVAGVWVGTRPPPPQPKLPPQMASAVTTPALPQPPSAARLNRHEAEKSASKRAEEIVAERRAAAKAAAQGAGSAKSDLTGAGRDPQPKGSAGSDDAIRAAATLRGATRAAGPRAAVVQAVANRIRRPRNGRLRSRSRHAAAATAPTSAGGSKLIAPPEPKGLVVFTLASLPPSATLYLDGKLITKNGVKRLPLETGRSYTMRCLPTAVCDECPPFKDVRFRVSDDPAKLLKKRILCDFRACCARSTQASAP